MPPSLILARVSHPTPRTCRPARLLLLPAVFVLSLALSACGSLLSNTAGQLAVAVSDSEDPQTVAEALPAYLLMVDALIRNDPEDADLLATGGRLYVAYAGLFVDDPQRARRLTAHARGYADRALCESLDELCAHLHTDWSAFTTALAGVESDAVGALYDYAQVWAGWLQSRSDDWQALTELPHLQATLERVVALEPATDHGNALAYLGVLHSQRPPALGGRPEVGREYFEQALAANGGNLSVKVLYARHYARLVFDQELHDRLLNEVLAAPVQVEGLTMSNVLAQRQARELLQSAADYF